MADDLEKKPQTKNETKKDEKGLKAAPSDTPKAVQVSSTKTKELKKDNPKVVFVYLSLSTICKAV